MIIEDMKICPLCGAMLYTPAVARHREFHQTIEGTAKEVLTLTQGLDKSASLSRSLLDMIETLVGQVVELRIGRVG